MDQRPESEPIETTVSPSRALVPVTAPSESRVQERPASAFVMQLIACAARAPDYRVARRAGPGDLALAYAAPVASVRASLDRVV
jgi:hypothetical protein